MPIPLTGSPPPADNRGERLTGNDRNFNTAIGNWTNSGGTLSRDTSWIIASAFSNGSLKHNTTAASQYVTVPVSGSFKAGQLYYAILLIGFEDTTGAWTGDISLGVQGTDTGSQSFAFTMDADYPFTGSIGEYAVLGTYWTPTASRTGVTLRVTRTAASGTYNMHIYSARVFASASFPLVQPLTGTTAENRITFPMFGSDMVLGVVGKDRGVYFHQNGDLSLSTGPNGNVGLDLYELSGGSATGVFSSFVESPIGDLNFTGYERYVGTGYLGEYTGQKSASPDVIQTYMDGLYDHEFEDASATKGYKFRAADGTGTGTDGVAWPAKGMLPAYASDPPGGVERQAYWNTTTKRVRIHDGTTWSDLIAAGGIPINWMGAWSAATTYAADDGVDYDGSSYVATASTTNDQPPASPWQLIAAAGTDGTNGQGVPVGGTTGQVLAKDSGVDFDTEWIDPPSGGSGFTVSRTFTEFAYDCIYDTTQLWPGAIPSGGTVSGTGAAVGSGEPGDSRHIGLVQLGAGTTTTGRAAMAGHPHLFGGATATYGSIFQIRVLSDGTNTFVVRAGWNDTLTGTNGTDAVMFRYTHSANSGKWEAVCRSNDVETAQDTGVTATASTTHLADMHTFEIIVNAAATQADFYIDGTLTNTVTTNIPSGAGRETAMYPLSITASAGTSSIARILIIDAYWYRYEFTTPR